MGMNTSTFDIPCSAVRRPAEILDIQSCFPGILISCLPSRHLERSAAESKDLARIGKISPRRAETQSAEIPTLLRGPEAVAIRRSRPEPSRGIYPTPVIRSNLNHEGREELEDDNQSQKNCRVAAPFGPSSCRGVPHDDGYSCELVFIRGFIVMHFPPRF